MKHTSGRSAPPPLSHFPDRKLRQLTACLENILYPAPTQPINPFSRNRERRSSACSIFLRNGSALSVPFHLCGFETRVHIVALAPFMRVIRRSVRAGRLIVPRASSMKKGLRNRPFHLAPIPPTGRSGRGSSFRRADTRGEGRSRRREDSSSGRRERLAAASVAQKSVPSRERTSSVSSRACRLEVLSIFSLHEKERKTMYRRSGIMLRVESYDDVGSRTSDASKIDGSMIIVERRFSTHEYDNVTDTTVISAFLLLAAPSRPITWEEAGRTTSKSFPAELRHARAITVAQPGPTLAGTGWYSMFARRQPINNQKAPRPQSRDNCRP